MEKGISKVKIDDISFQELMLNVENRLVRIPDFQREFVWERSQIISLLDSIYHHYPIGSFLLWRTDEEIESYRTIGHFELNTSEKGIVHYVLDGQQRITSLFASLKKADIKVKVNGKTVKKKLEIYFDLDEEVFLADPFSNSELKDIYKPKRIIGVFGYDNYFEFLKMFKDKLEEYEYSKEAVCGWLSEEIFTEYYASMFFNCCLDWKFIEWKNNRYQFGENESVIYEGDATRMLKLLATYFQWFDELYLQLSMRMETNELELKDEINKRVEEKIKDPWYVRERLHWMQGLGLGSYEDGKFTLSENGRTVIDNLLVEREEERKSKEELKAEYQSRFISVKKIVSSTLLKLARGLSDERYDALDKVVTSFQNYPFSAIYVLDQPIEVACEIFERINNSGKVLNLVDLMVAKSYSPSFNLRKKLNSFLVELSKEGYGDVPDVTIIQCLSAILCKSIKRRDILTLDKEAIRDKWTEVVESLRKAVDFLKSTLNLTNSKIIPYNTLLVPLAYYFYHNDEAFISAEAESKVKIVVLESSIHQ